MGRHPLPVLSCTAWGFSCPGTCAPGGGLLPRLFTLSKGLGVADFPGRTGFLKNRPAQFVCNIQPPGGLFSVTLSVTADFGRQRPRVLHGMLPYGVRTFLYSVQHEQRSSAIQGCKISSGSADGTNFQHDSHSSHTSHGGMGLIPAAAVLPLLAVEMLLGLS